MKVWSGYKVEPLRKRKWTRVNVSRFIGTTNDWSPTLEWLDQDHPGRYFVDVLLWKNGQPVQHDFYFEDNKTATEFALRWA